MASGLLGVGGGVLKVSAMNSYMNVPMKVAKAFEAIEPAEKPYQMMLGDQNVYANVYHVLVVGMSISTVLFVVGIVLALLHPHYVPLTTMWIQEHYRWALVISGLKDLSPTTIMMGATVLLILTPVVRVVVSIYAFY